MLDYENARRNMVETQLRTISVSDHRLLKAISSVAREQFVPESRRELAYIDESHALTGGRQLPPVGPIAKLLQLAEVSHEDKVLDIGAANGYTSAVLSHLAAQVVGLDESETLVAQARTNASALGLSNVKFVSGSFGAGAQSEGPFDVIIIEGTVSAVPENLLLQLKDGGRLATLIGNGTTATAHLYVRSGRDFSPRTEFNAVLPRIALAAPRDEFVF